MDRVTRRAFAAAVVTALTASAAAAAPPPSAGRGDGRVAAIDSVPTPVVRAWPAMGTMLQVSVWDADTARAAAAMAAARAAVLRVDSLLSVNRPASEVSVINRRAGTDSATALSPWTAEVLDSALSIAAASGGAADATAGPLADAWRSVRGEDGITPQALIDSAARRTGWRRVRFERTARRTWLPARGMRLDLDGIARGFAVDRGMDALRSAGITRAVVDLGGTYAVLGAAPVGPRWSVGLRNPFEADEVFAAVQVDAGAVATIGAFESPSEPGDGRGSRPIDPRSGRRARGVASVSVLAPSGILADALSTALYVMGPGEGCRLAARYPGVEAVWVREPSGEPEDGERDADDGVDPELVVITDGLADRLELLSEEPTEERPTRCSQLPPAR